MNMIRFVINQTIPLNLTKTASFKTKTDLLPRFFKKIIGITLALSVLYINPLFATPKEIIVIRHADKLHSKHPGAYLSRVGVARSAAFTAYYLAHFSTPDYIIATSPSYTATNNKTMGAREIETVTPLSQKLTSMYPTLNFEIIHSYTNEKNDRQKLINDLLKNEKYQNKVILICWHHTTIPFLLKGLGVKNPPAKVREDDYDTVFTIEYNPATGDIIQFQKLDNQYPVKLSKDTDD